MAVDVVLRDAGPNRLAMIKVVKTVAGLGLAEARRLVEQGGVVVAGVELTSAAAVERQLVEAGATVALVGVAGAAPAAPPWPGDGGPRYDVVLVRAGPSLFATIHAVKGATGMPLVDAKALAERGGVVAAGVDRPTAAAIARQLAEAGATVTLVDAGGTPG